MYVIIVRVLKLRTAPAVAAEPLRITYLPRYSPAG